MNYYGKLIVCDRCGKEQFLRMKEGILDGHLKPDCNFEDPEGWRLIPSPKSDYRSMIDVCPECFSKYRYTMDQFYANTNVKKDPIMTFYICNGQNPLCCNSDGCHMKGGNCRHTANETYSATEHCDDPQKHLDRFEAEVFAKLPTYYFERIEEYEKYKKEE